MLLAGTLRGASEIAIMSSQIISTRTLQGQIHAIWRCYSDRVYHVVCTESTGSSLVILDQDCCSETTGSVLVLLGLYRVYWFCTRSTGSVQSIWSLYWLNWVSTGSTESVLVLMALFRDRDAPPPSVELRSYSGHQLLIGRASSLSGGSTARSSCLSGVLTPTLKNSLVDPESSVP